MNAISKSYPAAVRDAVEAGIDPKALDDDDDGWTPLQSASYRCDDAVVEELLRAGANAHTRGHLGQTASDAALQAKIDNKMKMKAAPRSEQCDAVVARLAQAAKP